MALIDPVLRATQRRAFRRALAGEGWAWFALAGAAFVLIRARRPPPEEFMVLPVAAGDTFELTAYSRPSRRAGVSRRAERRAGSADSYVETYSDPMM